MAGAFDPVLGQPVPERLVKTARGAEPARRGEVVQFPVRGKPPGVPWRAREWGAMAASLALGAVISWKLLSPPEPLMTASNGSLVARGALASALERQLAGAQTEADPVRIGLSFETRDGHFCRSFQLRDAGTAGLALNDTLLAQTALSRAAESTDPEIRFRAVYNLGLLNLRMATRDSTGRDRLLAEARRRYREALLLKPEAPPLGPTTTAILEASGGVARIFDGSGGIALMDTYARGVVGTMPGPDLVWALRALWDALEAGDTQRSHDISACLTALVSMVTGLDGYVAFEKYMLVKQGVLSSRRMRGPVFYGIDDVTAGLLDELFDRLRASVA